MVLPIYYNIIFMHIRIILTYKYLKLLWPQMYYKIIILSDLWLFNIYKRNIKYNCDYTLKRDSKYYIYYKR